MEYAITKISTKGQIVIPASLRHGFNKGDEFLIIRDQDKILLKEIKKIAANLEEDFAFAKSTEKAWEQYDKGKSKRMSKESFLKELEKW